MAVLFTFVRRWTDRLPPVHLVRVFLRAIFGAAAFAPTLVGGEMAAFPAPASLVLALGLFSPDWIETAAEGQMHFALLMFGITAAIWFYAICGGPKAADPEGVGDDR